MVLPVVYSVLPDGYRRRYAVTYSSCQRRRFWTSIIVVIAGFSVALCWHLPGWNEFVHEGLSGIAAGCLYYW
jgi:hypothetical protein